MKCFITGGAGFIGSHIVDRCIADGHSVVVFDNLSTGDPKFIRQHQGNPRFTFIKGDILDLDALKRAMAGSDIIFHLAANADVRGGPVNRRVDLEQNGIGTWNVLEAMVHCDVKKIAFSSSATVYGEPETIPTAETTPLIQTSLYGASKLYGEALIQAYAEYFDMQTWIFRFVSWIGPRYSHGVIFDFVSRLRQDPSKLLILGDGTQVKSYLDVEDGVSGIFLALERCTGAKNVVNLGHTESMTVETLAHIVVDEMGLEGVRFDYGGGKRGWKGDSPMVHLDVSQLAALGWMPSVTIEQGIRRTVRYLMENNDVLQRRVNHQ